MAHPQSAQAMLAEGQILLRQQAYPPREHVPAAMRVAGDDLCVIPTACGSNVLRDNSDGDGYGDYSHVSAIDVLKPPSEFPGAAMGFDIPHISRVSQVISRTAVERMDSNSGAVANLPNAMLSLPNGPLGGSTEQIDLLTGTFVPSHSVDSNNRDDIERPVDFMKTSFFSA